jgi:hypothetical protein
MKTTLILVCIAVVLLLFRFLAIKLSKRLEKSELAKADSEPYDHTLDGGVIQGKLHEECETKQELFSEHGEAGISFVVPTPIEDTEKLEQEKELVMEGVPEDYNDVQNLTPFNHGTYRGKDGRFKSKKT